MKLIIDNAVRNARRYVFSGHFLGRTVWREGAVS